MMCELCEQDGINFGYGEAVKIVRIPFTTPSLLIFNDRMEWLTKLEIKYCPLCGRKLDEE